MRFALSSSAIPRLLSPCTGQSELIIASGPGHLSLIARLSFTSLDQISTQTQTLLPIPSSHTRGERPPKHHHTTSLIHQLPSHQSCTTVLAQPLPASSPSPTFSLHPSRCATGTPTSTPASTRHTLSESTANLAHWSKHHVRKKVSGRRSEWVKLVRTVMCLGRRCRFRLSRRL
jgi:hypothetical protein